MKQISIKKIKVTRFKGLQNLTVEFSPEITNIFGANGTGKTTVFDAFLWPLFDRDSQGQSEFNIKMLDANGKAVNRVGHEVELLINVDGTDIEVRRVYAERWVKERGSSEETFKGHENTYFWNGVPMKQVDFKKEVSETICDDYLFKMITSPMAFASLNWKDRRAILMEVSGEVSDNEIAGTNKAYLELIQKLTKYKTEEDYKSMLRASVEKSKKEIKLIPARIDEVKRGTPVAIDFNELRLRLDVKQKELNEVDERLADSTKAYQAELDNINAHNQRVMEMKSAISDIEYKTRTEAKKACEVDTTQLDSLRRNVNMCKAEGVDAGNRIQNTKRDIEFYEKRVAALDDALIKLRTKWAETNAQQCDDATNCPSCGQPLSGEKVDEIINRFKADKQKKIEAINSEGADVAEMKQNALAQIESEKQTLLMLEEKLTAKTREFEELSQQLTIEQDKFAKAEQPSPEQVCQKMLTDNADYGKLKIELAALINNAPLKPVVNNEGLRNDKSVLQKEIADVNAELIKEQQVIKSAERVAELEAQEKKLAQEIAEVDKQIFTLDEFTKLKVNEIERRVRDKFSMVSFRMFREQINGGMEPSCDILINGVPFTDANTASKINAGIDIINTLSKHYGVSAPIFIDNRESVVNIIETDSQLINLIVSPEHEALTVEALEHELVNS